MNYKPLIRKNKRTLKDLSAMLLWLFVLIFLIQYTARAENINPGLDPTFQVPDVWANGTVTQLLPLPENKTLIRGNFEKVHNQSKPGLARLTADGLLDNSFTADVSAYTIQVMAAQADGKILIGGYVNNNGATQPAVVRLNPDGTPDNSFFVQLTPNANGFLLTKILVQPDNKFILVGGFKVKDTAKQDVVRFNANGTPDAGFNVTLVPEIPNQDPAEFIQGIGLQPDNKILLSGFFTQVNGEAIMDLVRLLPDGTVDHTFTSAIKGGVHTFALQPDSKILVSGWFYDQQGKSFVLARLNPNGSLDNGFDAVEEHDPGYTTYYNAIKAIQLLPDGKILAGGYIYKVNGTEKVAPVVRINSNGSLDKSFNYQMPFSTFAAFRVLPFGILVAGTFNKTVAGECVHLARLHANGSEDGSFNLALQYRTGVYLAQQPDDKILVYGSFYQVGPLDRRSLARLLPNGRLDVNFNPIFESQGPLYIYAVSVLPDGKILVGGNFTKVNGQPRRALVKLNPNGTLDNTSNLPVIEGYPDVVPEIRSILVQPDNRVIISGIFAKVAGKNKVSLARLNSNNTLDESFNPAVDRGAASRMYYQAGANQNEGKIIMAGLLRFTGADGRQFYKTISRLNIDGTLDNSFALDESSFTSFNSFAVLPDGKMLLGGRKGTNDSAKLFLCNANGQLEANFNVTLNSSSARILAIAPQPDGKILVGGYFSAINGSSQTNIARLHANGSVDTDFAANLSSPAFVSSLLTLPDNNIILSRYTLLAGSGDLPAVQKLVFSNNVPPPAEQTITFAPVPNKTFGDAPFLLSATASSGLPVAFTVVSGPATVQGNQITLTGAGEVRVRAVQAGSDSYKPVALERAFCVNPAKPSITATANLLAFSGNTHTNYTYQWYRNGTTITGATAATYTATRTGDYTLTVSVGSCNSVSSEVQRVNIPEEPETEQIVFFPNPTRQDLQVRATAVAGSKIAFRLIAATGKLVWQKETAVVNKQVAEKINLQLFGAGLYVLQINTGSGWVSHKVVKI
ncbi:MAG: T9SS type A sorting domain-containing protein [Adhaeribacter sp.]